MIKGIITSLMFVDSIQESRDFYCRLFNIEPFEEDKLFCSFKFANTYFNLHLADEKSPKSRGGTVVYLHVEDIDVFIDNAKLLDMKIYRGPLIVEEIGRTICQLEDPFGNIIGIEG
ncbi:VOC family protein [Halobacteriovorax sp. HLS]|uniref:VOC family protein n=1 Tax=Halobacteriovorax sp. HLS TaxID=2234000 RepID=UPI000FD92A38|nr:VOC family protein [Halobacteriovorax sp. HLS]